MLAAISFCIELSLYEISIEPLCLYAIISSQSSPLINN